MLLMVANSATPYLTGVDLTLNEVCVDTGNLPSGAFTESRLSCAFNPAGTRFAMGYATTPYLTVFDTSDWSSVTITGGNPGGGGENVRFSPNGSFLAVCRSSSPYLVVYNTSDWSKATLTGGNPDGYARRCAFSHDSAWLAVSHDTSPYLTIYNTSDWSKVTITGGAPTATGGGGVAFNHDSSLLATAVGGTTSLTVYNTSDWSKVTITGGQPTANGNCVAFSPDGSILAHGSSSAIQPYTVSTWAKETLTGGNPGGNVSNFVFDAAGAKLYVAHNNSPRCSVYTVSGWTKATVPGTYTAGATDVALSPVDIVNYVSNSAGVGIKDDTGANAIRTVRLYLRSTGVLLSEETSNSSGIFGPVPFIAPAEINAVYLDDSAGTLYNDLIHRVIPA